jgi:hypothetical protein
VTFYPAADTAQKDFTLTNSGSTVFGNSANTRTASLLAETIYFFPFTPTCGGELSSLSVTLNAAVTGNMNCALYEADGSSEYADNRQSSPGTLIANATAIPNPASGENTFVWTSTPSVRNGALYYVAVWCDAAFVLNGIASTSNLGHTYTLAYSGTFPSAVGQLGSKTTLNIPTIHATITPTNSGMVNDYAQDGDTTYISGSTAGNMDLYTLNSSDISAIITGSIFDVEISQLVKKNDSGTKSTAIVVKSDTATATSSTKTLNTAYNYQSMTQNTDPNTSATWTKTALAAAKIGPEIIE